MILLTAHRTPVTHRGKAPLAALVAATALLLPLQAAPAADAHSPYARSDDPGVVTSWNQLGVQVVTSNPTKPGPQGFLYIGFLQVAVYDAVVGVHRRYEQFRDLPRPARPASAEAAALAAAHGVLLAYVPTAATTLNAAYSASLAGIRPGQARDNGLAYGATVAQSLIDARANDGRDAPFDPLPPPAPGVWRPTPPAFAPMASPWLGAVTPLALSAGDQFDPGPPPALSSTQYTADFAEVKALGAGTGSTRTPDQTATALFYSGNAIVQFNAGLRDQVATRDLDLVDAARLLAAVTLTQADTAIAVWNAKKKYPLWRPSTAIQLADTDGNPATEAQPSWQPLVANPNYPDWVSGYSAQAAAFGVSLSRMVGDHIDAHLISTAVPGATRTYATREPLQQDVVNGRMWLGVHFLSADVEGATLGRQVANFVMDHHFAPTEDD
jgi:hypothetical protein